MITRARPATWKRYVRRGVGDLATIANVIQTQEGWFPGSVSQRNNNPGNLKCAGQPGVVSCDPRGFAVFSDYAAGYQALQSQISLDASRGLSIADFMAKYAPASDANDPASYAAKVAQAAGLQVSDPLAAALGGPADTTTGDLTGGADVTTSGQDNTPLYLIGGVIAGAVVLALVA